MNDMLRICQTPDMFAKDFWEGLGMTFDRAGFGVAVSARRRALGYSQTGVPGGPSSSYMSQIEHGKMDPITSETLDKLATGLRWDRVVLGRVYYGDVAIDVLPIGPLEPGDSPKTEGYVDQMLREAEEAQIAFEKAADALVAAEAELDRANWLAFKIILIQERMQELGIDARAAEKLVTSTDLAQVLATHATLLGQEWTRFDMAILERFDPSYVEDVGGLVSYQRYMDMTAARKRASLIPLSDEGGGIVTPIRPSGGSPTDGELSEVDESVEPAADDVQDAEETPGESDSNE